MELLEKAEKVRVGDDAVAQVFTLRVLLSGLLTYSSIKGGSLSLFSLPPLRWFLPKIEFSGKYQRDTVPRKGCPSLRRKLNLESGRVLILSND